VSINKWVKQTNNLIIKRLWEIGIKDRLKCWNKDQLLICILDLILGKRLIFMSFYHLKILKINYIWQVIQVIIISFKVTSLISLLIKLIKKY
jgi:hypothetical protein